MKKQLMKDLFRESILFLIGGFIYVMIEIIGRGFSDVHGYHGLGLFAKRRLSDHQLGCTYGRW